MVTNLYRKIIRCEISPDQCNLRMLSKHVSLQNSFATYTPTSITCALSCTILTINDSKDLLVINNGSLMVIVKLINHICSYFSHYKIVNIERNSIRITFVAHKVKYTQMLFEYCELLHYHNLVAHPNMKVFGDLCEQRQYPLHEHLVNLLRNNINFSIESFHKKNALLTIAKAEIVTSLDVTPDI